MSIDKTKDKIIKSAKELFMKKGYDATSMSEISKLVGINKASLYYFFKDKESLYFEIMKNALNKTLDYLKSLKDTDKPDMGEVIENLLQKNSEDSVVAFIISTDSFNRKTKKFIEIHNGMMEVRDIFIKLCKKAGVEDPQVATEVTLNAIHAHSVKASCHKPEYSPKRYAKYLSKLLKK